MLSSAPDGGQRDNSANASTPLVVIPRLDEVYLLLFDQVDDAVFLRQPTGPCPGRKVFQMLRLANPSKRVSQSVFHYVQSPKRSLAINLDPIAQILDELRMEYCAPGGS